MEKILENLKPLDKLKPTGLESVGEIPEYAPYLVYQFIAETVQNDTKIRLCDGKVYSKEEIMEIAKDLK